LSAQHVIDGIRPHLPQALATALAQEPVSSARGVA